MTYPQLGPSGLTVSVVGLGCNNFGARMADEDVPTVVDAAIDAGITLFDTADVYGNAGGSETLLGEALKGRRDEVVIATKFGMDMGGAQRTGLGRARFAPLHPDRGREQPAAPRHRLDRPLPAAPTRSAHPDRGDPGRADGAGDRGQGPLHRLLEPDRLAGGRRRLDRPDSGGYEAFVSAQNEYSWLNRDVETELVPALEHTGQGLLPFFPLARGLLTGKYRRGATAPDGTRLASQSDVLASADFDTVEALAVVRRRARTDPAAGRDRRAGGDADGRVGDRRRDEGVPDRGQRGRRVCGSRRPTTCRR